MADVAPLNYGNSPAALSYDSPPRHLAAIARICGMALTPSNMLPLGTSARPFSLSDVVTGRTISLTDFSEKRALLVIFLCAHCPYVVHVRKELAKLARDYAQRELAVVAISSNDPVRYPEDAPEGLRNFAIESGFAFPVLFDESQEVALAYSAACTPDFFLFDAARRLVYRGQLDDSRPGIGQPDGRDLRAAIDCCLAGAAINPDQKPSVGCNIKWKSGNQPKA
jgi:peroxiredoxin